MKTFLFFVSLISFILPSAIFATTYTWHGTTNSYWSEPTNWVPTGIPDFGDDVTVASEDAQIILTEDITIHNFDLNGSKISGNQTLLVTGTMKWMEGTITCSLSIGHDGVLNYVGSGTKSMRDNFFDIAGIVNQDSDEMILFGDHTAIENRGTINMNAGDVFLGDSVIFVNGGFVQYNKDEHFQDRPYVDASDYLNIKPEGSFYGEFNVHAGKIVGNRTASIINAGTFNIYRPGRVITGSPSFANEGTITIIGKGDEKNKEVIKAGITRKHTSKRILSAVTLLLGANFLVVFLMQ